MATEEDAATAEFTSQKKKKEPSELEKRRKKIVAGSLMKAEMRPGGGDARPSEGDQVIYHCTVRTLDGVVVQSTKSEYGGKGTPVRQVLGKSKMLLGLLEGLPTMLKGEVAMDDCPVLPPSNFPKDDEVHFEVQLIEFSKVKVVSDDFGVTKQVLQDGQGWESPREPYEVKAWISAKTGDGKVILSRKQEPYFFTFGKSEVPKGLEMGIGTMAQKEKAVIYVTSQHLTQSPLMSIEAGFDEVHFEVELVHFIQVRDMLGDGRLIKRRLRDGKGEFPMDCPLHDSLLRVHYKGKLLNEENTVFYDTKFDNDGQPLEFSSGEGTVPEGFEMAVRLMLPGEIALVTSPPDYAYDKFPRPPNVPEGAQVQWEIELLGFEMPRDWTGLNFQSIMDEAAKIRNTGNRLFKEGKYELAKAKYEKNLLYLNVAACYLKLGECRKSIEECNKVLDANPAHVKALYRRGMAYMTVGDFDEARTDFEMMMKVDKSSEAEAKAALAKLKQNKLKVEKRTRRQFQGLFDKKPGEIAEAGVEEKEEQNTVESTDNHDREDGGEEDALLEDPANPARVGLFSRLWPTGKRLLSALGLQRCTIL
ncbi:hypothetical protein K2173_000103 [Erythroxylum novogranatense]|uniref:peptidylprolyl isomerase n=1 Tax=Erythroxylum novogranatense TaxID=1862640 RepID=A0AAV8SPG2_9ROSI|nr:hypothetical protein K2173_000103 [Erythroxylum novogranatense]